MPGTINSIDATDVVYPVRQFKLSDTAKLGSTFYNKVTRKRELLPLSDQAEVALPFHVWGNLSRRLAAKVSDIPDTWDARWDFFKPMQKELRGKGMRRIYESAFRSPPLDPTTATTCIKHFMIANGGKGIVTPDGKLHTDDPQVREAAIKSTTFLADSL